MYIGVIGINHKSAELSLREKLAKACESLFDSVRFAFCNFSSVLLTTCGRTEIYFHSPDLTKTHIYLLNAIRELIEEEFEHRMYSYFGSDCFLHLARVTSGVDSAIFRETEIQGQVKRAYLAAQATKELAPELHFLFQKCLKIGKQIRSENRFSAELPSLEEAVVNVGKKILGDIYDRMILFVGLSEINYKILKHFKKNGYSRLFLCNRTLDKAQALASVEQVSVIPWSTLATWPSYDFVIFGTKSPQFLAIRAHLHAKPRCKLVMDLSVPRNVDPRVKRGTELKVFNVDQIAVDKRQKNCATESARLETHAIAQAVERQAAIFRLKLLRRQSLLTEAV